MLTQDKPEEFRKPRWVSNSLTDHILVGLVLLFEAIENLPFIKRSPWIKRALGAIFNFGNFLLFLLLCLFASSVYRLANKPQATLRQWVVLILFYCALLAPSVTRNPKVLSFFRVFLWCFFGFIIARVLYLVGVEIQNYYSTHAWWEPLPAILWMLCFGTGLVLTGMTIDRMKQSRLPMLLQLTLMLALCLVDLALLLAPVLIKAFI
jgi:hypothetical protein